MKFGTAIEHHECLPGIRYGAQSKIQYGHQAAILNSGLNPTEEMTIHHLLMVLFYIKYKPKASFVMNTFIYCTDTYTHKAYHNIFE